MGQQESHFKWDFWSFDRKKQTSVVTCSSMWDGTNERVKGTLLEDIFFTLKGSGTHLEMVFYLQERLCYSLVNVRCVVCSENLGRTSTSDPLHSIELVIAYKNTAEGRAVVPSCPAEYVASVAHSREVQGIERAAREYLPAAPIEVTGSGRLVPLIYRDVLARSKPWAVETDIEKNVNLWGVVTWCSFD